MILTPDVISPLNSCSLESFLEYIDQFLIKEYYQWLKLSKYVSKSS